jgi:hypothetical protein
MVWCVESDVDGGTLALIHEYLHVSAQSGRVNFYLGELVRSQTMGGKRTGEC